MFIIICIIIASVLGNEHTQSTIIIEESNKTSIHKELEELQWQIAQRRGQSKHIPLKISQLFQHSLQLGQLEITLEDISLLPSIAIPYRDNTQYPILLKKKNNIYSLKGQLILNPSENPILVSSVRNEQTYFAQMMSNGSVQISRIKVQSKRILVQVEISIVLSALESRSFDHFVVVIHTHQKLYVFASSKHKKILIYDRNGSFLSSQRVTGNLLDMKKIGNYLAVLSQQQLLLFDTLRNFTKIDCLVPYGGLEEIAHDDGNLAFIYGKKDSRLYKFSVSASCRPISSYQIPMGKFQHSIVGGLLFILDPGPHYVLNLSSSQTKRYNFPFGHCPGKQKVQILRKQQGVFIVSQLCLLNQTLNLTHLLLELQQQAESTDFSKFRIPLLFLSFGIIIYVTVKNRSRPAQQKQQQQQEDISLFNKQNPPAQPVKRD